ncbi:MAG: response regulator transcription factor [Oscillospiraceae bacterium]|nr:response regulator transcription factor [Oscillospiraceae bacterium]
MRIAICDDEQKFLENEAKLICDIFVEKGVPQELMTFNSPKELLDSGITYDMIFLDIEMPEMSGIDLARQISQKNKDCSIFFITNYPVYLDKAFDVNAIRFFTKPVDRTRLSEGIDRALERIDSLTKVISVVNFDNKLSVTLSISSIIFIENIGRRTRIVSTEYDFIAEEVFSSLKNQIGKEVNYFAAPHQSYFVNLHYVTAHNKTDVTLSYAGKTYSAEMSRRQYNEFDKKMFLQAKSI